MTEKQLDELFPEMTLNTNSRVRKKCLVVYLRKKGYRREEVAELLRIDEDTVTNYTKKYDESGLQGLLEQNYHQPKSQLEPYTEQLKELFKNQVPHTVNHGETVLNFLTSVSQYNLSRILCHAQVIEYLSYITSQLFDSGCNTVFTNGFNQPSGKSAQTGYVFRPMAFAYRATIFMPIPIE